YQDSGLIISNRTILLWIRSRSRILQLLDYPVDLALLTIRMNIGIHWSRVTITFGRSPSTASILIVIIFLSRIFPRRTLIIMLVSSIKLMHLTMSCSLYHHLKRVL